MSTPSKSLIGLSSALVALILALFSAFFWLDRRVDAHRYAHADTNGYAYCDGDAHTHHHPDAHRARLSDARECLRNRRRWDAALPVTTDAE